MFTLAEFQAMVRSLRDEYQTHLPVAYWEEIANPWFYGTFPVKSEEYGVDGLQRLGPSACVAEFVGCFYRWVRMMELDYSITAKPMRNALEDAFGYAVIMRTMAKVAVTWATYNQVRSVYRDMDQLIGFFWEDRLPVDQAAATIATRVSLNMYRRTPGA